MGIVHHSNYIRYLELGRVHFLAERHRPYTEYVAAGLHFAVTRVECDYRRSATFDEELAVCTWLEWVRGASLRLAYTIEGPRGLLVCAATEHAMASDAGRVRRIPPAWREELARLAAGGAASAVQEAERRRSNQSQTR